MSSKEVQTDLFEVCANVTSGWHFPKLIPEGVRVRIPAPASDPNFWQPQFLACPHPFESSFQGCFKGLRVLGFRVSGLVFGIQPDRGLGHPQEIFQVGTLAVALSEFEPRHRYLL